MHHIQSKAKAILIKSFLETSIHQNFIRNNFHQALYQWHVLGNKESTNPGIPPYFSGDFYEIKAPQELHESDSEVLRTLRCDDIVAETVIQPPYHAF